MKTHATDASSHAHHSTAARKVTGTKNGERFEYTCELIDGDGEGDGQPVQLCLEGDKAEIDGNKGEIDLTYKPRYNKDFVRYSGLFTSIDGYGIDTLIGKPLLNGAKSGFIKTQARGEGYFGSTYRATRKN